MKYVAVTQVAAFRQLGRHYAWHVLKADSTYHAPKADPMEPNHVTTKGHCIPLERAVPDKAEWIIGNPPRVIDHSHKLGVMILRAFRQRRVQVRVKTDVVGVVADRRNDEVPANKKDVSLVHFNLPAVGAKYDVVVPAVRVEARVVVSSDKNGARQSTRVHNVGSNRHGRELASGRQVIRSGWGLLVFPVVSVSGRIKRPVEARQHARQTSSKLIGYDSLDAAFIVDQIVVLDWVFVLGQVVHDIGEPGLGLGLTR